MKSLEERKKKRKFQAKISFSHLSSLKSHYWFLFDLKSFYLQKSSKKVLVNVNVSFYAKYNFVWNHVMNVSISIRSKFLVFLRFSLKTFIRHFVLFFYSVAVLISKHIIGISNYAFQIAVLCLIINISRRMIVQDKIFIRHIPKEILLSNILMLKL